jgi:hypothetical protein
MVAMLDFLRRVFNHGKTGAKEDGLTQTQREALMDLLVFAEFNDNYITEAEALFVHDQAAAHPWQSTLTIDSCYDASVTRTRSAKISAEARSDYLDDIALRLGTPAARRHAFELCELIMRLDPENAPTSRKFLDEIGQKLRL